MEYNADFQVLFERSILYQLFDAYRYEFPEYELVDAVYANVRTYTPGIDIVRFTYRERSDYYRLVTYLRGFSR